MNSNRRRGTESPTQCLPRDFWHLPELQTRSTVRQREGKDPSLALDRTGEP